MQLRPPARLLAAAGALALATVLSSCGFNYATDRIYTPAEGTNDNSTDVDVLGAVVVSGQEGSGTFIASFANNEELEEQSVDTLEGAGETADLTVEGFEPIELPAGGIVNLATEGGVVITGDFGPGDFVTLAIGFANGETIEMDIPVTPPCDEYEGLDISAEGDQTYTCEVEAPEVEH